MTEQETIALIRKEVARQVNVILSGQAQNSGQYNEDIQNMFPGMNPILQRPVMHPYGFASRAPDNTISVVARQGDHIGNRIVLGHRAADRPADLNTGESVLYNEFGQAIYMRDGEIQIGSKNSDSPAVLGDVLLNFITDLLNDFLQAPQIGQCILGPVWLDPTVRLKMITQLAKYVTVPSTNVVSQSIFVERGGA